jgi:type IV pilus assembly protein PilV
MTTSRYKESRVKSRKSRGFSLLESLIAILLLSVGAIGVAGLQVLSLKNSKSADQRARVASMAQMMVDEASLNYNATINESATIVDASFVNFPCASTPTTVVQTWRRRLDCNVPGAKGSVNYDLSQKRLVVRVQWDDSQGLGGSAAQEFVLDTRL